MTSDSLQRVRDGQTALDRIAAAKSTADLRAGLARHYPGFDIAKPNTIAIVGAAGEGSRLAALCRQQGIALAALADDNPSKIGTPVEGHKVERVGELNRLDRATPIVIASHRLLGATERLRAQGFKTVLPFAALQALAPERFPAHMFYDGLLEDIWSNREHYAQLADRLADRRSRDVLDAVLNFRLTLDPAALKPVLDADDLYVPKNLIDFSEHEVYVDGGSYDGDTIRTFMAKVGSRFDRIYAFEPDPATYAKLKGHFSSERRVEAIHAGLHREAGVLRFRDDASRGAIFATDGTIEMPVTTLDTVIGDGPVTYIKMNIEGAEIDALHGAEKAIRRERPKLALSVYHRPSDLWRIPDIVQSFDPGYKLHLRQHDGGIIETVLYALHH
jgi:FkbM family methyltransferase